MSTPLTKEQIEMIIEDRLGIDVTLYPVPNMIFSNRADYYTDLLNNYPYLYNARYYARTSFDSVDVYLTFDNEIRANRYDGGYYICEGTHYIVLLKNEKIVDGGIVGMR